MGYSTEMAITDRRNMLQNNLDDGYFTCCTFLNLSKAFDTVKIIKYSFVYLPCRVIPKDFKK